MIDVAPIEQVVQPIPEKPTLKEAFTKLPQKILNVVQQLKKHGAPQVNNATLEQIAQGDIKELTVIEEPTVPIREMNYPAAELRGITKCHQTLLTDLGELDCIGFPAL